MGRGTGGQALAVLQDGLATIREAGIMGACGAGKRIQNIYKNTAQIYLVKLDKKPSHCCSNIPSPAPIPLTPGILLLRRLHRDPVDGVCPGAVFALLSHIGHLCKEGKGGYS